MRTIEKGKKLKSWVIHAVISQSVFRTEYLLEPTKDNEVLRAIVYDMQSIPDSFVWDDNSNPTEQASPCELRFLRDINSSFFPELIDHEECYPYHWGVVRTPKATSMVNYIKTTPSIGRKESVDLVIKVCKALKVLEKSHLHHYNLTKSSVLVTPDKNIILDGLGYISKESKSQRFYRAISLNSLFLAPELFLGEHSVNADVFSACLMLYSLISGRNYPWNVQYYFAEQLNSKKMTANEFYTCACTYTWDRAPKLSSIKDEQLVKLLKSGLNLNPAARIPSVNHLERLLVEFIKELQGDEEKRNALLSEIVDSILQNLVGQTAAESSNPAFIEPEPIKTGGFADLAGMDELKEELMWKFIKPIRHKKLAKGFGITPPNGCLLYGPPGCGKTYCAEKIAEEAGINFRLCRPSEVASTYVHGGQGLIKEIFDEARKKAPILLFWDEADAIATRRDMLHEHYASEVNELLAQMNNAAADGVYVFLACNFPEKLDSAILRRGRIDERFYVPLPDAKGREDMFRLRTADLPKSGTWDYGYLAHLSDGFSYADLEYVITECRRICFRMAVSSNAKRLTPVKQVVMEDIIKKTQPSLSRAERAHYEEVHNKMIGSGEPQRRKIGF